MRVPLLRSGRSFRGGLAALLLLTAAPLPAQSAGSDRVVSLGGSVTEIVYALDAGDRLVGTDASSVHPAEATRLPQVGYFRQLPAEGILSLRPTLVLATSGTGPPATLAQLRSAGVRVVEFPEHAGVEGARARIRAVARALGLPERGEALVRRLDAELAAAEALRARASSRPRVLFVYARGTGTVQVAGRNTAPDEMIRLAGGVNAAAALDGTRPLTAEAAVAAAPEVILVPARGLETLGGVDGLLRTPGLALTPAGRARRVIRMDDLLLLGFGPRTGVGVAQLVRLLHPEVEGR